MVVRQSRPGHMVVQFAFFNEKQTPSLSSAAGQSLLRVESVPPMPAVCRFETIRNGSPLFARLPPEASSIGLFQFTWILDNFTHGNPVHIYCFGHIVIMVQDLQQTLERYYGVILLPHIHSDFCQTLIKSTRKLLWDFCVDCLNAPNICFDYLVLIYSQ